MDTIKRIWQRFGGYVMSVLVVIAVAMVFIYRYDQATYLSNKATNQTLQQTYQHNKTKISNNDKVLSLDQADANSSLNDISTKVDKLMSLLSTTKNVLNNTDQAATRSAGLKNYFVLKNNTVPMSLLHLSYTNSYQLFIGTARGQKIPVIVTGTKQNSIDTFYQLRLTYDVVAQKFVGATQDQYRGGGVSAEN